MKAETFECACGHKLTGRKITLDSKDIHIIFLWDIRNPL